MSYKNKEVIIKNKDIIEVTKSRRLPVKNRQRSPKTETTTRSQEEINNKNAIDSLRLLILENFNIGDWFFTLSYSHEPSPKDAKRLLGNFRQRLIRHCKSINAVVKYIFVTECTPKIHRMHHHAMIKIEGAKLDWQLIKELWTHGFVKPRPYAGEPEDAERVANYMVKKNVNAFFTQPQIFKKRWWASTNLKKPPVTQSIVHRKKWLQEPRVPKGYYLDKNSLTNSINNFGTGLEYEYQFYRLIRIKNNTNNMQHKNNKLIKKKNHFTANPDG